MTMLLAAALLFQDPSAETAFKKILETAMAAKSCVVDVKLHRSSKSAVKSDTYDAQSTMFLQDVNKAQWSFSKPGSDHPTTLVSDGARMKYESQDVTLGSASPKTLKSDLTTSWVLLGNAGVAFYVSALLAGSHPDEKFSEWFHASGFENGPPEGDVHTLSYTFTHVPKEAAGNKGSFKVKLWYAPTTSKLNKRTWTGIIWGDEVTVTEIYERYSLNTEIPEEKFRVADEKK